MSTWLGTTALPEDANDRVLATVLARLSHDPRQEDFEKALDALISTVPDEPDREFAAALAAFQTSANRELLLKLANLPTSADDFLEGLGPLQAQPAPPAPPSPSDDGDESMFDLIGLPEQIPPIQPAAPPAQPDEELPPAPDLVPLPDAVPPPPDLVPLPDQLPAIPGPSSVEPADYVPQEELDRAQRDERRRLAREIYARGGVLPISDPRFEVADYFSPEDVARLTRQALVQKALAKIAELVEKSEEQPAAIKLILGTSSMSLLPSFAFFRTVVGGRPVTMLQEAFLSQLYRNDPLWLAYMLRLLAKLKTDPASLTTAEIEDILYGKKSDSRRTLGAPLIGDNGVIWEGEAPLRGVAPPPPLEAPASEAPRKRTSVREKGGRADVANVVVVPVRANSCHMEVKLYGRYMRTLQLQNDMQTAD